MGTRFAAPLNARGESNGSRKEKGNIKGNLTFLCLGGRALH